MKKIVSLIVLVLCFGLFAACGLIGSNDDTATITTDEDQEDYADADATEESEASEPRGDEWQGGVTRGFWENNMYINEYLNMRFVAPHDWVVATDDEVAQLMGIGIDMLFNIDDDFWDVVADSALIDMMVSEPFGSVNVQIIFERLVFPMTRISAEDYVQRLATEFESDPGLDARANVSPGTVVIGDYEWHSVRIYVDMFGITAALTYFVNVHDGFARAILVTYQEGGDSLDFVLASFSSLSDPPPPPVPTPPPPPPPEPVDVAIVGSWVWDADDGYIYEFLADGSGRRGWYPDVESFSWSTIAADNHLTMHFGLRQESWTYTIIDDVMTLDNRQNIGESYSYLRWEGDFVETVVDLTGHPLLGTWVWDSDSSYIYVFEADGTGVRGFANNRYDIHWVAYDEYLFMDVGTMIEEWAFEIVGDILTIVSLQAADLTWSYVRQ